MSEANIYTETTSNIYLNVFLIISYNEIYILFTKYIKIYDL